MSSRKRVLLIAFQYPPMTGTSGIQRALRFSQYLPKFGWDPIVLTAHPRAYDRTSEDQMNDIPSGIHVSRVFALDAARHLSILGRYPSVLAVPDRWNSWRLGAVPEGLRLIRRLRPEAIWSTFPIPTAHRIGLSLHRLTGLPWVADFRDVMTEEGYPADARMARAWRRLEQETIRNCSVGVFTTPGAVRMYANRYPEKPSSQFAVIENGYDEEVFAGIERLGHRNAMAGRKRLLLVHSGVIYPMERDPRPLFQALGGLCRAGVVDAKSVHIVLRATGDDRHLSGLIGEAGIQDIVELAPPISYREALTEMLDADGLLVLQGDSCSRQIPAKLYECLRSRRPILGLASGDTANALQAAGIDTVAPLGNCDQISQMFPRFLDAVRAGTAPVASCTAVERHSRLQKTAELADILSGLIAAKKGYLLNQDGMHA